MSIAVYNAVIAILAGIFMDETLVLAMRKNYRAIKVPNETDPCFQSRPSTTGYQSCTDDRQPEMMSEPTINLRRLQGISMPTAMCVLFLQHPCWSVLTIQSYDFIHMICFDKLFPLLVASDLAAGTGLSFNPRDIAHVPLFARSAGSFTTAIGPALGGSTWS